MAFKLFPYKMGSLSGKALANALGIKRIRPYYEAKRRDIIINWGNSRPSESVPYAERDLNKHSAIAIACNKLKTFDLLYEHEYPYLPNYCTTRYDACNMLYMATNGGEQLGKESIYCRTSLTSHSGGGIVIAKNIHDLVDAPLYTVGTRHKYEYRVHVFRESVIDVQQKKRRSNWTGGDTGIRNHSNGYIYARADIDYPVEIQHAAIQAVKLLGLDFGAVDIGYRERDNKIFLFEVNTAPGLTGTTLLKYAQTFKEYLNNV
jgi:hypothetical protein